MKKISVLLLACALEGVTLSAQPTAETVLTPELINQLAEEARTNNSALLAGQARVAAAEAGARSIPQWRNPEFFAGGMAAETSMRAEDGDILYGVEQALPVFGKETAARKVAEAMTGVEKAALEFRFQELRKNLATALFQAALADEMVRIAEEDLVWLGTLVSAVEQRYQSGDASQVDLLRVQNDRSKRATQVVTDQNARGDAFVTVNRLLNRNVHSEWGRLRLPPLGPAVNDNPQLLNYAMRFEPRLLELRRQTNQAEALIGASRKEKRPDLSVGVEGRQYSETGEFRSGTFLLKFSFPWLNSGRYQSAIKRDEARLLEVSNEIEDYVYQVQSEVHHLTTRIDAARREALLYRDEIIPRSRQALASAEAAWRSSRDAFRDLLDARRMLLEAQGEYYKAVAVQYVALAELILCCGIGDLEALEMLSRGEMPHESVPDVTE